MSITTLEGYASALKATARILKTPNPITTSSWTTCFSLPPNQGSVTVNTTSGIVPTSGTTGAAPIFGMPSGSSGVISGIDWATTMSGRQLIYDRLWYAAGTWSAGTTTLASQPSFSSRVPGGTDYSGTQIWVETNNATTWNSGFSLTVTYTNQAGTTGCSTTFSVPAANTNFHFAFHVPLAPGDSGVSKIESVTTTLSQSYTIFVARPLAHFSSRLGGYGIRYGIGQMPMVQVYQDSCIALLMWDSVNSGTTTARSAEIEISVG